MGAPATIPAPVAATRCSRPPYSHPAGRRSQELPVLPPSPLMPEPARGGRHRALWPEAGRAGARARRPPPLSPGLAAAAPAPGRARDPASSAAGACLAGSPRALRPHGQVQPAARMVLLPTQGSCFATLRLYNYRNKAWSRHDR
ncbi:unnamed protein product [Urochloa humidicola]